jgi:hypothetical protein
MNKLIVAAIAIGRHGGLHARGRNSVDGWASLVGVYSRRVKIVYHYYLCTEYCFASSNGVGVAAWQEAGKGLAPISLIPTSPNKKQASNRHPHQVPTSSQPRFLSNTHRKPQPLPHVVLPREETQRAFGARLGSFDVPFRTPCNRFLRPDSRPAQPCPLPAIYKKASNFDCDIPVHRVRRLLSLSIVCLVLFLLSRRCHIDLTSTAHGPRPAVHPTRIAAVPW